MGFLPYEAGGDAAARGCLPPAVVCNASGQLRPNRYRNAACTVNGMRHWKPKSQVRQMATDCTRLTLQWPLSRSSPSGFEPSVSMVWHRGSPAENSRSPSSSTHPSPRTFRLRGRGTGCHRRRFTGMSPGAVSVCRSRKVLGQRACSNVSEKSEALPCHHRPSRQTGALRADTALT